jgi:hypothetical protein
VIVHALKETVVLSDDTIGITDVDAAVQNLDKELSEILGTVDASVRAAEEHIKERLLNGEDESVLSTASSSKISVRSSSQSSTPKSSKGEPTIHQAMSNEIPLSEVMQPPQGHPDGPPSTSSHAAPVNNTIEPLPNLIENPVILVQQNEVQDASERLENLQEEQNALGKELQKKSEIFELNKQRIKDAQSIVSLNKACQ